MEEPTSALQKFDAEDFNTDRVILLVEHADLFEAGGKASGTPIRATSIGVGSGGAATASRRLVFGGRRSFGCWRLASHAARSSRFRHLGARLAG